MKVLALNELTVNCMSNGWDPENRSWPTDDQNLRDYFTVPATVAPADALLTYNVETEVVDYPKELTLKQRNDVHSLCNQLDRIKRFFQDESLPIKIETGFSIDSAE